MKKFRIAHRVKDGRFAVHPKKVTAMRLKIPTTIKSATKAKMKGSKL
jgi:hypothetical protein